MASARCPICDDWISLDVPPKLHQSFTCPTCLSALQVISINPLEFDEALLKRKNAKRNGHMGRKGKVSKGRWRFEEEDFDEEEVYLLERRYRQRGERRRGG